MPILVIYGANGVSRETYAPYEAEMAALDIPKEALLHVVGRTGGEGAVVDVWENRAAFEAFTERTINPLLVKHGIPIVPPQVLDIEHVISNGQIRLAEPV